MRHSVRGLASAIFGLALAAGHAPPAWARSEKTLDYPRDRVWAAAVRFLVVDEHVKVTDKDADAGYVVFELRDDGKLFRGALELATVTRDGRSAVRFILQIEDRPSWLEIAMLRRLETKLRAELGSPAPPSVTRDQPDKPKPPEKAPEPPPADDNGPRISPTP